VTAAFARAFGEAAAGAGRGTMECDRAGCYDVAAMQLAVDMSPQVAFDLPTLPPWLVNGVAGFGDTASFGLSAHIRSLWDIGSVDSTSGAYEIGSYAGVPATIGTIAAGGVAVNVGLPAMGGANTLYHYTSLAGASAIGEAGAISAGSGVYGAGVYATAVRSSTWAALSGARSTQAAVIIQGQAGRAIATPWPGTFRFPGSVPIR